MTSSLANNMRADAWRYLYTHQVKFHFALPFHSGMSSAHFELELLKAGVRVQTYIMLRALLMIWCCVVVRGCR